MVYVLTVAVWLISADGTRLVREDFGTPAPHATMEECTTLGREAVARLAAIEGVAGAAFVCVPRPTV